MKLFVFSWRYLDRTCGGNNTTGHETNENWSNSLKTFVLKPLGRAGEKSGNLDQYQVSERKRGFF